MSENINVFLEATRLGLRFETENHTNLTVEQLWQLPLTTTRSNQSSLDGAGKVVKKALREQEDDGIVTTGNNAVKAELELKLAVLVAIVDYKQAENKAKLEAVGKQSEKAQLQGILATKKAAALENLSEAEIEERLRKLG